MENKVVEKNYIKNEKVALKSNVGFLATGLAIAVIYLVFSIILINHISSLSHAITVEANIFAKIVYLFNSKIALYVLLAEFLSVVMTACFLNATDSEVYGIFMTARVSIVVSVITFLIPLFVIVLAL